MPVGERWRPRVVQTTGSVVEAIYGLILATSVIAVSREYDSSNSGRIAITVFVTGVVFWLAHVYSRVLAGSITRQRMLNRSELRDALRHDWPLVEVTVPLVVILGLGAIDVVSDGTAILAATLAALVELSAAGWYAARASGAELRWAVVSAAIAVVLGSAVVLSKPSCTEMEWALALVAIALLGVGAVSRRLSGTPITPAMLFVAFGLLVGPKVLDGIDVESSSSAVRTLAEATLALVLFCDASRIDLGQLRREVGVPLRLLGIGLPLTIALGAVAAAGIFSQLSIEEAVILAIVLAPTDAALGQAVVTEPRVPKRIRQGLNVESGLNDGICVPLLFAAVAVADVESGISHGRSPGILLLEEIGYGIVGGVAAGLLIAAVIIHAGRRDLIAPQWRQVIPAAGAALAYGIAVALHGSGFIAAFVGGIVFRWALKRDPEKLNELSEDVGNVLNGVTFVLFGAILLGPALGDLTWELALYAVLSLTVVRMVPVAIAMFGSRARPPTIGFLGWFGPRGLASIVFAVIVVEESALPHEHLIGNAIYVTVGLSVLAHGISAAPLADRYARWFERHPRDRRPPMESLPAEVTRARGTVARAPDH